MTKEKQSKLNENIGTEKIVRVIIEQLKKNNDDCYMTVDDVSDYLKISKTQAYALVNQPDFPRQRIGKSIRVSKMELKEYLKRYNHSQINL